MMFSPGRLGDIGFRFIAKVRAIISGSNLNIFTSDCYVLIFR